MYSHNIYIDTISNCLQNGDRIRLYSLNTIYKKNTKYISLLQIFYNQQRTLDESD